MKTGSYLSILLVALLFTPVLQAQQVSFDTSWKKSQDFFRQTLEDNSIVGGAFIFLENGEVKSREYFGLADISLNHEVNDQTIFHWASITKTFTAIAIMQLRDRGLLSLNDPLTKYLPVLKQIHNPFGSMYEITIKMALSHSTGLRNSTWPWGGGENWHPFEPTSWDQLVAMFPYSKIEFEPGSRYSYSNPAIIFLGQIIEIITGDKFEEYMEKNVFKPLKMNQTYFDTTPYHLLPFRSNSYTLRHGVPEARGLDFDTGITASNGGLNAPLKDMVKYLNFLAGQPTDFEVLKHSTLEEMWKVQHKIEEEAGLTSSVALGFHVEEFNGMKLIGHTGTQHSFYSFFYVHPKSGTAVLGITNTDGERREPDLNQIRNEISRYTFKNLFFLYK